MYLILYSKPGCHLCEGLQEKLAQVQHPPLQIETRDITTREDWFEAYQYEIPVLYWVQDETADDRAVLQLPRFSPRATARQVEQMLQKYLAEHSPE